MSLKNKIIQGLLVLGLGLSPHLSVAQTPPEALREIAIVGSELIGGPVVALLQRQGEESGVELNLKFKGSRPAQDALQAGVADFGILLENPHGGSLPEGWVAMPVAHVTAFVIAPASLTIDQLTYQDLARIYAADSSVATTRWGEFGAGGRWGSVPITANITTPAEGLAYEIFRHRVLPSPRLKVSVRQHDSMASTREAIEGDEGGIAVVPWWDEENSRFKTLLIAPSADEVAFGPTPQNIAIGDYPLAMTLSLVFERSRATELLPWLKYWYSDELSEALQEVKLMPLPRTIRNQMVFDLEVVDQTL